MALLNKFVTCEKCGGQKFEIIDTCSIEKTSQMECNHKEEYVCMSCKTILILKEVLSK